MRWFSLILVAGALVLAGAHAQARPVVQTELAVDLSPVQTIARISGYSSGFAQSGDRIAWVCGAGIQLLNVRTGRRSGIAAPPSGRCDTSNWIDLELAGDRVLVLTVNASASSIHFQAYTGTPRTNGLRHVSGGRSDLAKDFVAGDPRSLTAGSGSTLALTGGGCDLDCNKRTFNAAKVVVGTRALVMVPGVDADALTVGGGRLGIVSGSQSFTDYALVGWLPNGSVAASKSGCAACEGTAWVSIAADGRESPLPEPEPGGDGVPSPDGSKVALVKGIPQDGGGELHRLVVRDVETGREQNLGPGYGPAWSPDGTLLLYSRPFEKVGEVATVEVFDGVSSHAIARGDGGSWSPDGRHVAYRSDGEQELRICNPDGGADHLLAKTQYTYVWEVRWSPDSRALAFSVRSGDIYETIDIWRVGADGSGRRRLTHGFANANPLWSPDGKRIAFTSDRILPGRITEVFTMDADGRNQRRLSRREEPAATVTVADIRTRKLLRTSTSGTHFEIALSRRYKVILRRTLAKRSFISISEAATAGAALRTVPVDSGAESLSVSGRTIVFRVGRTIYLLDAGAANPKPTPVAVTASTPIGLSIEGNRVAWLETSSKGSRARAFTLTGKGFR